MSPITRPTRDEVLLFDAPEGFRAWLEEHHATVPATFIGYYRKGVGRTAMTYAEAVDEALCYGWIDGITYRVDDEITATRFTPRRSGSYWSAVNIAKVERLASLGRMTPSGLAAFAQRDESAAARYSYENRAADLPEPWLDRLRANHAAARYWNEQAPSYRRAAAFWVMSAKREATRERRLGQLIEDSAGGRPIRLLSYGRQRG